MIIISLWYDINKKIYSSDKKSDWIKTYADEKCKQTKEEITADMSELETYVGSTAEELAADISELNTSLSSEISSRQALSAQHSALASDVSALGSSITSESSARASADTSLGNRITSEASARASADTSLGNRITSETSARTSADTTLDNKITAEVSAREGADSTLSSSINAISSARGQANGYAPLDANAKIPEQYIYGKTAKEYGMRWLGTSDTSCVRLGDAVGLTATAYRGSAQPYHSDFDSIYPWSDMKLCNVDKNGQITAYIGEPNFKRDGSNGDVMVEIPKFYYKRIKTGTVEEWWICGEKLDGYELHPAFTDGGQEMHKLFVGAYNGYLKTVDDETKLISRTQAPPSLDRTLTEFRTYAKNKGANWGVEDYACLSALQMLFVIEFANMNSQAILGNGIHFTGLEDMLVKETSTEPNTLILSYSNRYKFQVGSQINVGTQYHDADVSHGARKVISVESNQTADTATFAFDGPPTYPEEDNHVWEELVYNGMCDTLNGKSGTMGDGYYNDVCYRGIEGIFGKFSQAIDGISGARGDGYFISTTMSDYENGKTTGTYEKTPFFFSEGGGIKALGFDQYRPWIILPCVIGGTTSTYIPDYVISTGGTNCVYSGVPGENISREGIFAIQVRGISLVKYRNARLMFKK